MYNDDNSVTIVFNGKIYNFEAVGTELEALGHGFLNNVDTETIFHGWKEWGPDCVRRLSGMFAFALWDRNSEMLFWARDRLGTKPLYYSHSAARVVFGSEMHALAVVPGMCRKIRPQAVDDFFAYGYLPEPEAIFVDLKNCRQAARSAATRPRGYQGLPPLSAAAARMSSAMGAAIDMVGDISPENVKSAMRMALDAMGAKEGAMRAALREMEREDGPLIPRPQQRPQTPPPATTQPAPTSQPATVPPVAAQQPRPAPAPAPEAVRTQPPTQPAAPAAPVRAAAEPGLPFIPPRDPRPLEMRIITEPARPSAPAPATTPTAEQAQPPRAAPPTVKQEASEQTPPRQRETTPPAPKPKKPEASRDAGRQPSLLDSPPMIAEQPQTPAKKTEEPESKQPNAATAPMSETPELTPEQLADKNRKARRRAVLRAKGRGGMGR